MATMQVLISILFVCLIVLLAVSYTVIYRYRQKLGAHKKQLLRTQLDIQQNIGEALILMKINLNNILIQKGDIPKLVETKNIVGKTINDLRNLTRNGHSGYITNLPLSAAILQVLQVLVKMYRITTNLQVKGKEYRLPLQQEMVIFSIVRDLLRYATKCSHAQYISVVATYSPAQFSLTVTGNGRGFDPKLLKILRKDIGFKRITSKAHLIGASLSIDTAPTKGASIIITLPIHHEPITN